MAIRSNLTAIADRRLSFSSTTPTNRGVERFSRSVFCGFLFFRPTATMSQFGHNNAGYQPDGYEHITE
jgi:hypothetical protein